MDHSQNQRVRKWLLEKEEEETCLKNRHVELQVAHLSDFHQNLEGLLEIWRQVRAGVSTGVLDAQTYVWKPYSGGMMETCAVIEWKDNVGKKQGEIQAHTGSYNPSARQGGRGKIHWVQQRVQEHEHVAQVSGPHDWKVTSDQTGSNGREVETALNHKGFRSWLGHLSGGQGPETFLWENWWWRKWEGQSSCVSSSQGLGELFHFLPTVGKGLLQSEESSLLAVESQRS